jgi:hypothetical protein
MKYTKPRIISTTKAGPTIQGINKAPSLSNDTDVHMRTTPAGYPADE